ncbi:Ada metal-binding domain-containing protein [Micromonospora sp. NPDC023737]
MKKREERRDGVLTAVKATGICCRPSCREQWAPHLL